MGFQLLQKRKCQLFSANRALKLVAIDILGLPIGTKKGNKHVVISKRFFEFTLVIPQSKSISCKCRQYSGNLYSCHTGYLQIYWPTIDPDYEQVLYNLFCFLTVMELVKNALHRRQFARGELQQYSSHKAESFSEHYMDWDIHIKALTNIFTNQTHLTVILQRKAPSAPTFGRLVWAAWICEKTFNCDMETKKGGDMWVFCRQEIKDAWHQHKKDLRTIKRRRLAGSHKYMLMMKATLSAPSMWHLRPIQPESRLRRDIPSLWDIHVDGKRNKNTLQYSHQ